MEDKVWVVMRDAERKESSGIELSTFCRQLKLKSGDEAITTFK